MPLPPQFRIIPWSPPAVKSKFSSVLMQNSKFHLISLGQSFPWSFLFPAGPGAVCILPVPPAGWPKGSARPKPSLWGEGAAAYAATDEGPSFSRPSRGRRICQRCSALRGDGKDTHPTGRSASSRLYFSPPGNFFPLPPSNRVKDGRVSRHYGAVPHRPYQKSKEGSYETRLRPAPPLPPRSLSLPSR